MRFSMAFNKTTLMKSLVFFSLFSMLFCSCQMKTRGEGLWVKKIDSEELSRIIINFATKMKIEKHLELEDSWAAYDDNIKSLCLQFTSQRLLTVYDARLLMVELVEDLLYRINHNSIIGFELENIPFTADNLDVKISFQSFYGRYVDEQYVGLAWLQAGCVHFYAFDRKDPSLMSIDWSHQRFEPYAKSRELALIKRTADLPYVHEIPNPEPSPKQTEFIFERFVSPVP
jgi:hypothetical protein